MVFSFFIMEEILAQHIPQAAIDYCIRLGRKYTFSLDLSFNRKTKFGHYKYIPKGNQHIISINKGLDKPLFLITYLHELAHLEVSLTYGRKVQPHGKEWKQTFSLFLQPVLGENIFAPDLLKALKKHANRPKASLAADPQLWNILFNEDASEPTLDTIEEGQLFIYRKRTFKKLKNRRTRALCFEPATGQKYLIPRLARIEII